MVAQLNRVDSKKREHEHRYDCFAQIGLESRSEVRHRQPDEDRGRRHKRAVTADMSERGREGAKQLHYGKNSGRKVPRLDSALGRGNPYIRAYAAGDWTWHAPTRWFLEPALSAHR